MNFYEMLEELENKQGSIAKEQYLIYILKRVRNAESYFNLVFNDKVYGVKEQTFKNAFNIGSLDSYDFDHISDWLKYQIYEPMNEGVYKVQDLFKFTDKLLISSGHDQEVLISNFIRQCEPLKKKWFTRAILKDLRCGIKVKTMNKCFKAAGLKTIDKFSLQLCGKIDLYDENDVKKKLKFPCSMECKYDGIRLQAEVYESTATLSTNVILTSRRGKDKTADYPEIVQALKETFTGENIILDGEIISDSFQELTRKDSKAVKRFVIWDILNDEKLNYLSRWDNLISLCADRGIAAYKEKQIIINKDKHIFTAEHYSCNSLKEAQDYYESLNERGEEGIIIKLDASIYERNSRKHMFKCKKVHTSDLLCFDYKLGTGKRSGMVSTLCLKDLSGNVLVDVGSGITDFISEKLTKQVQLNRTNEFIGKIVEIAYNELTTTGSIRFPRFKCFRGDKNIPDDLSNSEIRQG